MTASQLPSRSPLARFVLFMICLSVAGAFVAGVHYFVVDLPLQNPVVVPSNAGSCFDTCMAEYTACETGCSGSFYTWWCSPACFSKEQSCVRNC